MVCSARPHFEELYLHNNIIGDGGAEKIADALPSMPNLTELTLDGSLGDAAKEKLRNQALPSLTDLDLD